MGRSTKRPRSTPGTLPVRRQEFYPYWQRALELAMQDGTLWPIFYRQMKAYEELQRANRRAERMRRWYWRLAYGVRFLFTGRRPTRVESALPGATESVAQEPGDPAAG